MRERAISAVGIVAVVAIALVFGAWGAVAVATVLAVLAGREALDLLARTGRAVLPAAGILATGIAAISIAVLPDPVAPVAAIVVILGIVALWRPDPVEGFGAWSTTAFGVLYVAALGFVGRASVYGPPIAADAPLAGIGSERAMLVLLIAAVWSFDTGAYLVGRAIGRRPFFSHISPKKTAEGVAGGLVVATLAVALVLWLIGRSPLEALLLGPLLGIAAQAGDLAESMLKRSAGAKDSGTLIPGHGGFLDRTDSFLFAAPALVAVVALADLAGLLG
jgi:phosphatidate cytidylyltransferase